MSEEANLIVAKMRVEEIKSFYVHAGIYTVVNIVLVLVNIFDQDEVWWSVMTILGWGVGLLIHGLCVFGPISSLMMRWEQRKIAQLMHKE